MLAFSLSFVVDMVMNRIISQKDRVRGPGIHAADFLNLPLEDDVCPAGM